MARQFLNRRTAESAESAENSERKTKRCSREVSAFIVSSAVGTSPLALG